MKRRDFLAVSALLSLLAPSSATLAANRKKAGATSGRGDARSGGRSGERSGGRSGSRGGSSSSGTRKGRGARSYRPVQAPASGAPAEAITPSVEQRNAISLPDEPLPQWRNYDVSSLITLHDVRGKVRLWLPLAQPRDAVGQRSLGHSWQGNFDSAGIYRDPTADLEVFYADWKDGSQTPRLQLLSQVAKHDRHFDITRRNAAAEKGEVLRRCLQSSNLVPTDGLVRRTAERAIGRIKDPVAQGKAIYDWVVDNTTYDPTQSGIGRGDIEAMLDSGQLSGKSADIALLFVALCRSIGIPARPVFGLRIDSSRLFAGLGATGNLRAVQHCRAEFYTPGYGWIPVDPGDVRKAIHDERLSPGDPKLVVLRKLLFGFWEMNWIAYNSAQDVRLFGATGGTLPFFVQPQAEAGGQRFDSSDVQRFSYTVSASRVEI
ncbi:transglutaminase family protein [Accumulibacter sp.]|uniref:transglutaminase-like domain-containing protein n=1 Tax=Accumulibacter sp. TaxID=2053492 RepID=UPI0025DE82CB|nr:transglutaminase-like domain-containing protein [Accumulibacter sp.]MCM8595047.1 transglutaminase-like domain-containing protein [Accumulibacter sp.]MCM8625430.1 transglutaminase-like domain-containing protein [Accumulibacter sp.]MDS4049193.1 transglutaminase-like domain-containing protein [Accumulibacter sp.]